MDAMVVLSLGALKGLLMLIIAGGMALTLRNRSARLRAVIWGTALVGSLLIPFASSVMPSLPVVIPLEIPQLATEDIRPHPIAEIRGEHRTLETTMVVEGDLLPVSQAADKGWTLPSTETVLMTIWAALALVFFVRQCSGLWRMAGIIRRARPVTDEAVLDLAAHVCRQVGCGRRIRLVTSSELDIPAVFGMINPVVILPVHSRTWLEDRLAAVLQHELIHVIRLDWPLRIAAHFACAIYWFNPLAWWAKRRLDLEQEKACDEEVLSLGSRASSYACHLLGIARTAVHREALANAGLEMARRSDLEERIMSILNRPKHRKVGLAVILPAAILTAALVPAIAAVQPTEPGPRKASPELKAALAEMEEAERRIEPHIQRISEHAIELEPILEKIEAMELEINHEAIDRIHAEMKPFLEQIEDIHIDMEPVHAQLETMSEALESMTFHIDDGTLEEVQRQIHEQMEAHRESLETVHIDMAPYHEQLEAIHAQLEPLHEKLAELNIEEKARIHEQIMREKEIMGIEREEMILMQKKMERVHEEMEPFHQEMELAGERIEAALHNDVEAVLRSRLGSVTSPTAPFAEAAARIVEKSEVHIHNGVVELDGSRREIREILNDLFGPSRVGTQDAFDDVLADTAAEISDLEIRTG